MLGKLAILATLPSNCPHQSVTKITNTGQDVFLSIQAAVECGGENGNTGRGGFNRGDALRRGDNAQDSDVFSALFLDGTETPANSFTTEVALLSAVRPR